jgi:hypothetical protein
MPLLLQDVPLQTRLRMWIQHDGAPPNVGRQVISIILIARLVVVVHKPGLRGNQITRSLFLLGAHEGHSPPAKNENNNYCRESRSPLVALGEKMNLPESNKLCF